MPALPSCHAVRSLAAAFALAGRSPSWLPRAAEMNEPEILVGKLPPAVGLERLGPPAAWAGPPGRRSPHAGGLAPAPASTEQGTAGQGSPWAP